MFSRGLDRAAHPIETAPIRSTTDPAGKLQIRIQPGAVSIDSSRPVRAASVFLGRGVDETSRLLPALFSICGTAQSAACAGALEQALRIRPGP
ncbi:MAG: hypothetical protein WAM94_19640, partial [Chromatiaceae bacterium]